jgi:hypothetical protein
MGLFALNLDKSPALILHTKCAMKELDLLIEINQKLDSFLEESLMQNKYLLAKSTLVKEHLDSDDDWNRIREQTAKHYLDKLLQIYQGRGLDEFDLILALSIHFESRGLKKLAFETDNLIHLLPKKTDPFVDS